LASLSHQRQIVFLTINCPFAFAGIVEYLQLKPIRHRVSQPTKKIVRASAIGTCAAEEDLFTA
jgi:hypothetical protein